MSKHKKGTTRRQRSTRRVRDRKAKAERKDAENKRLRVVEHLNAKFGLK